jgi:hypothetical protein
MYHDVQPLVVAFVTAACAVITAGVPLVIAWMKQYFAVREAAAMNQTVTAAASRLGAILVSEVPDIRKVGLADPALAELAYDLMKHYPESAKKLGLDMRTAKRMILGEAHKIYNTGLVPAPKG